MWWGRYRWHLREALVGKSVVSCTLLEFKCYYINKYLKKISTVGGKKQHP